MEKIIKYGIPILAALLLIVQIKMGENKASSSADGISVIFSLVAWGLFFVGLLIAGLIFWFTKKNPFLLWSFGFSIVSIAAIIFLYPQTSKKVDNDIIKQRNTATSSKNEKDNSTAEWLKKMKADLKVNPTDADALEKLGLFFYKKGDYRNGIPYLKKAVENHSEKYEVYSSLSRYYLINKEYQNVVELNNKVLELEKEEKLILKPYEHTQVKQRLEKANKALK